MGAAAGACMQDPSFQPRRPSPRPSCPLCRPRVLARHVMLSFDHNKVVLVTSGPYAGMGEEMGDTNWARGKCSRSFYIPQFFWLVWMLLAGSLAVRI